MIPGDDPLAHLLHSGALQCLLQLQLSEQEALQQCLTVLLVVGQHAQFLNGALRQVLRFIDDQQYAPSLGPTRAKKRLQITQQCGFGKILVRQPEGCADHSQNVVFVDLGGNELRCHHIVVMQFVEEIADQHRLAGADAAGDDNKALALTQAIAQIGHGPVVPGAVKEKARVGTQLERFA